MFHVTSVSELVRFEEEHNNSFVLHYESGKFGTTLENAIDIPNDEAKLHSHEWVVGPGAWGLTMLSQNAGNKYVYMTWTSVIGENPITKA